MDGQRSLDVELLSDVSELRARRPANRSLIGKRSNQRPEEYCFSSAVWTDHDKRAAERDLEAEVPNDLRRSEPDCKMIHFHRVGRQRAR